jgi:hypothetical protein
MADIPQVLATYDALVGVALGAGLTYWLGALNRRHQEAREDKTRWYEARLKAYIELSHAMGDMTMLLFHPEEPPPEARFEAMEALHSAQRTIHIVGSPNFFQEADALTSIAAHILQGPRPPTDEDKQLWTRKILEIESLARHDLGYPNTWGMMMRWLEEDRELMERAEKISWVDYIRGRLSAKMMLARWRWRRRS